MGVVVMPFGVCAEDAPKSDKALDAAPAQPLVSEKDTKARDTINTDYSGGYLAQRLGAMQKSTELVAARVLDHYDMPLGKVSDLLVGLEAGRIYCALVSRGEPEALVAVPGRSFLPAENGKVILDMDKEKLNGAPKFGIADWDFAALRKSIGESYAYFSQKPLWEDKAGLGKINKGSDFIGMEVMDKDNQSLGKVKTLMVDLPTARIVFAVISLRGTDDSVYAVPPQALMLTADGKVLFLDDTKAKIEERAKPNNYFWTELTEKDRAAATYRAYGIEPDFEAGVKADPTREQVRAKVEDAAPSKAAGKSDSEITRMVLTAMIQEDMNSAFNHKNIKINTVNGHVTLTGKVKNGKQKDKLGEVAEDVVGQGYVDNQLETK
jgi:osmotically-inducible protein OsmY/sporulation protein YlmC with PRC-barrel domain